MSKAILVLDEMPDNCALCSLAGNYCDEWMAIKDDNGNFIRSPRCPLIKAPKESIIGQSRCSDCAKGYIHGWNDCLREIGVIE